MSAAPKISDGEFTVLSRYIAEQTGIVLSKEKTYLLETRLGPLIQRQGIASYSELHRRALGDAALRTQMIDAMTTNETSFFRDERPFQLFAHKLVPDHFERHDPKRLRIWCAAVSTGQELYSIAIALRELLGSLDGYDIQILGTDISSTALGAASAGRYSELEVSRGLSPQRLARHFAKNGTGYRVDDELRALAVFKPINLLAPIVGQGPFDIVFCRNVAIYFSPENRARLFDNIAQTLRPRGVLVIGSTETLMGISDRFIRREFHRSVYYERP